MKKGGNKQCGCANALLTSETSTCSLLQSENASLSFSFSLVALTARDFTSPAQVGIETSVSIAMLREAGADITVPLPSEINLDQLDEKLQTTQEDGSDGESRRRAILKVSRQAGSLGEPFSPGILQLHFASAAAICGKRASMSTDYETSVSAYALLVSSRQLASLAP